MRFTAFVATFVALPFDLALARTVPFTVTITKEKHSPDGGPARPRYLMNGVSPGPALNIDEGDDVEFLVINASDEPTSIHFHGIDQRGTPWSDGVPGLSQKPIPPFGQYLYRWRAENQYGAYFYHGHFHSQISDGLVGPIYIRPAKSNQKPFKAISHDHKTLKAIEKAETEPVSVIVADSSFVTAKEFQKIQTAAGYDIPCTKSILVNGRGRVDCLSAKEIAANVAPPIAQALGGLPYAADGCLPVGAPFAQGNFTHNPSAVPADFFDCHATNARLEKFVVGDCTEWASFNFISANSVQAPVVSIDEHKMWVYAIDGRYTEPALVDGFQMFNGERYSVMVHLNQKPGDYTIRFANSGANQVISGFATMSYADRHTLRKPSESSFTYAGIPLDPKKTSVLNVTTQTTPFDHSQPAKDVDATLFLKLSRTDASENWSLSRFGNDSYPDDFASHNPLVSLDPNNSKFIESNKDFIYTTKNNTWVDLVVNMEVDGRQPAQPPHALHKHSNKAYLIGAGPGQFTWSSVSEAMKVAPQFFNLETPAFRDTFVTPFGGPPSGSFVVIRYHVENPGPFLFHCHIQPHLAGGMAAVLLDGVDAWPKVPKQYRNGRNGLI